MDKMILTYETDIYAFFEVIDRTEADSILDVGMFLKRIGSVSRQVKDKEIPADKKMVGVDFFPEIVCPVWNTIYDAIYKPEEIFSSENHQKYELAVMIQVEELAHKEEMPLMWNWLSSHVSYLLTDWNLEEVKEMVAFKTEQEITVDGRSYRFITL
ncbi:hypothetical protein [Roseburia sp. 499]|uniref:hypothetical protein n=1 Tax=Roseburia sp. 499 TaxID=1261634 RepID=UPI0009522787|nr:hypothetical protein [Roseburia sp. 499]WVK70047.1 hypothetical protein BIV20_00525 [Roseburia sp. 499]